MQADAPEEKVVAEGANANAEDNTLMKDLT